MIKGFNPYSKLREPGIKIVQKLQNKVNMIPAKFGDGSFSFPPVILKLYINEVCNASCIMCDIGTRNKESVFTRQVSGNRRNTLSPTDLERLIKEVRPFRPDIAIHGLEPLLHKNLNRLLEIIKTAGLRIHLVTNGILLKEKGF